MKECVYIISFYNKKSTLHACFFYPHINSKGYLQAPSNKRRLPQDRTRDFAVSSQPGNFLLYRVQWVSDAIMDAIATKGTFTMGIYQAGYLT